MRRFMCIAFAYSPRGFDVTSDTRMRRLSISAFTFLLRGYDVTWAANTTFIDRRIRHLMRYFWQSHWTFYDDRWYDDFISLYKGHIMACIERRIGLFLVVKEGKKKVPPGTMGPYKAITWHTKTRISIFRFECMKIQQSFFH